MKRSFLTLVVLFGMVAVSATCLFQLGRILPRSLDATVHVNVSRYVCEDDVSSHQMPVDHSMLKDLVAYFDAGVRLVISEVHHDHYDASFCHMTYDKAKTLMKSHRTPRTGDVNLVFSSSIDELWVGGFATIGSSYTFVSLEANDRAMVSAHEIGHALSLVHPFQEQQAERARLAYLAQCDHLVDQNVYNLMDYLPLQCGGKRFFTATQLSQMSRYVISQKVRVSVLFVLNCICFVVILCDLLGVVLMTSLRHIRSDFTVTKDDNV